MFQNWEFLIAEIWGHLLVAVILTLFLSWVLWGMRARNGRAAIETLRVDLQKTKTALDAKDSDLSQAFMKQEQLKDRMSTFQSKLTDAVAAQKTAEKEAAADRAKLNEVVASRHALQKEIAQLRKEFEDAKAAANAVSASDQANGSGQGNLTSLRNRITTDVNRASAWTKNSISSWFDKAG